MIGLAKRVRSYLFMDSFTFCIQLVSQLGGMTLFLKLVILCRLDNEESIAGQEDVKMTHERIMEIQKQWNLEKKRYGKNVAASLSIPVIISASSADAEMITEKLARFVYTSKILQKTNPGHEDYLFFSPGYTPHHDRVFPAIQELYDQVRVAGGYYGSYRGILLIDISEWRGHFRDRYFDIFLSYIADLRMYDLIPFIYSNCPETKSEMHTLEAVLSSYFTVTQISIGAKDLCKYAVSLLEDQKIQIDNSARSYLEDFLQESTKSALFHGSESVRHICERVICKCEPGRTGSSLDGTHLKSIINDLGYFDIYHKKTHNTIGFR